VSLSVLIVSYNVRDLLLRCLENLPTGIEVVVFDNASRDGTVAAIDNLQMARIARLAGAPMDQGAGVDLYRKVGDPVRRGEALYAIYAEHDADFRFASNAAQQNSGFTLTP